MKLRYFLYGILPVMAFVGCEKDQVNQDTPPDVPGDSTTVAVSEIRLNSELLEMTVGDSALLTAVVLPEDAEYETVLWNSADGKVASVDDDGLVHALAAGETVITASVGDVSAECKVTVAEGRPEIETVLVEACTFRMGTEGGGPFGDEFGKDVTLTQDYRISAYEITNEQYAFFLNDAGVGADGKWADGRYPDHILVFDSKVRDEHYNWGLNYDAKQQRWAPAPGYEKYPAIYVTWYGADEFARWAGGSLPTEAQWECACRAGTETVWSFGDDESKLKEYAQYAENSADGVKEVGLLKPNDLGLYDMHGNVWEWTSDYYYTYDAEIDSMTDPVGPESGSAKVIKGGCWNGPSLYTRSGFRNQMDLSDGTYGDKGNFDIGFRVVFVE